MAIFGNKKTTASTNIPELQEYYANQKNDSTARAWLLAVGSLLVTAALLIGFFFGGRWIYRKIANKDDKAVETAQNTGTSSKTGTTNAPGSSSTTKNNTNTTKTTPSTTTPSTSGSSSSSTSTTSTTAQGVATTQSAATNKAATAASTVPNTGPGSTFTLFALVTVFVYFVHRSYTLRKLNK